MPGRGSVSGHASVVDQVAASQAEDPVGFERARTHSLQCGASERKQFATDDIDRLCAHLGTNLANGLSMAEAAAKLEEYGPNLLAKTEAKSFLVILAEQVNILNMLVLIAGVVCMLQGRFSLPGWDEKFGDEPDYQNGCILFGIVAICMVVGAYMEWSCSWIMADVSAMNAPTCQVFRDGLQQTIEASSVVPGDVVVLGLGDVVPADARVIQVTDLLTNEMPLTGEPHDITKTEMPEDPSSPFPSNMLYGTTNVVNGSGRGLVIKTGMSTEMGKIAETLKGDEVGLTSVQKTMNKIGRIVTIAMIVLVAGIFCISYGNKVDDPADPCPTGEKADACFFQKSVLRCLFNAVGAIPETLQPAAMFLLVVGCRQMIKVNAQTRRLAAVDTLGSCSFICSDKTGTLTEGKMTCMCLIPRVRNNEDPKIFAFYPTRGFDPNGGIYEVSTLSEHAKHKLDAKIRGESRIAPSSLPTDYGDPNDTSIEAKLVHATMLALYLNSYSTKLVEETKGVYTIQGNMSEGALVVAAAKAGLRGEAARAEYLRDSKMEVPFSSSRKMMATVHKLKGTSFESIDFPGCTHFAIVKGAPDKLLPHLKAVLTIEDGKYVADSRPLDESDRDWYLNKNGELSAQALRVLAMGIAPLTPEDVQTLEAGANSDEKMDVILGARPVLMCILGLMDPPRESAKKAVEACHKAGMRVAMITGDQKPTAMAIAKDLGIIGRWVSDDGGEQIATECSVLEGLRENQAELDALTSKIAVWARAQPNDKVTIVESLQRQGHCVAMTGDGVNDAGALKKADIGVAMGIAGTDVAKGAADMVLMDDRFATIVDAVAEGRRIFANIQKMVAYLLCVNIFEVICIMFAMVFGWAVPLEDQQLFKANFITHEFYPWCMVLEAAGYFNMYQPPRDRSKTLIPRLMRNVLMTWVFFSYCSLFLIAQMMGSYMYCQTVFLEYQMGTTSVKSFYDANQRFTCLYAHSLVEEKGKNKWMKDQGPLVCIVNSFGLSGWTQIEEWGHGNKTGDYEDVAEHMNKFSGSWGHYFDFDQSFFPEEFRKPSKEGLQFTNPNWKDKYGWLQRCQVNVDEGTREADKENDGKADNLCWTMCGDEACWRRSVPKKTKQTGRRLEDDDDDDDDDDEGGGAKSPPEMPVLYHKFNAKAWGVRRMRSTVLLSMVLMEFAMLYAFSKFEFGPPLVFSNMLFPIAWGPMLLGLFTLVYFPIHWWDNEFAPLDICGLFVAIGIAAAFYCGFEGIKVLNRQWFEEELKHKMAVSELSAEGKLRAYAGVRQAREHFPARVPLIAQEVEMQGGAHGP